MARRMPWLSNGGSNTLQPCLPRGPRERLVVSKTRNVRLRRRSASVVEGIQQQSSEQAMQRAQSMYPGDGRERVNNQQGRSLPPRNCIPGVVQRFKPMCNPLHLNPMPILLLYRRRPGGGRIASIVVHRAKSSSHSTSSHVQTAFFFSAREGDF